MKKIISLQVFILCICSTFLFGQANKNTTDSIKPNFKKRYIAIEVFGSPLNITYGKSFFHNDRFNCLGLFSVSPLIIAATRGIPAFGFGMRTEFNFEKYKHLNISNETKMEFVSIYYPSYGLNNSSYLTVRINNNKYKSGIQGSEFILSSNVGLNYTFKKIGINIFNIKLSRTLLNTVIGEDLANNYFIVSFGTGLFYKF
jgi:hypothetical protein